MSVGDPPAELRVHGVGGPQARKVLGVLHEEELLTLPPFPAPHDGCDLPRSGESRFVRRLHDDGTEAYEWGGLTTGSWTKALWVVYLPFTLLNAAGWAHHAAEPDAPPPWGVRLHLTLTHVLAVLATATYVAWVAYVLLDLVAVRWRRQVGIAAADGEGPWLGRLDAVLPWVAVGLFVAAVGALGLAPVRRGRFEEVGATHAGPWPAVPRLADRSFFAHAGSHRRLLRRHTAAGAAVAVAAIVQRAVGWDRLGISLLLLGALQAVVLLALVAVELAGRLRHAPGRVFEAFPDTVDGVWRGPTWLPVGATFALLGTVMAHAAFAGTAILVRPLLARWPPDVEVDDIGVGAELGLADVLAWTLLLTVVGIGVVVISLARRRADGDAQGLVVRTARRVHVVAPVLWLAVLVPLAWFAWRNAAEMDLTGGWWAAAVRWYDEVYRFDERSPFQRLGSFALAALPVVVFGILRGNHESGPARVVGNLWDVLTFWPRRFHPFAAPCSAERSVPELRARLEHTLLTRRRVLVTAHSQGSVLAAAAVASACLRPDARVDLVTYGSPLGTLYAATWPAYVPPLLVELSRRLGPDGWTNFWRPTDPVGAGVHRARNRRLADPQRPTVAELDDAVGRVALERPAPWGSTAGHGAYLADPAVRAEVAARRAPPEQP